MNHEWRGSVCKFMKGRFAPGCHGDDVFTKHPRLINFYQKCKALFDEEEPKEIYVVFAIVIVIKVSMCGQIQDLAECR